MSLTRTGLLGLVLAGAATLSACGSDPVTSTTASGAAPQASNCAAGSLTAGGSSAQANAMTEWVNAYQAQCAGSTVNYQSVGSGTGRQNFASGTFDFAGSDSALKPEEQTAATARCQGNPALDLPMVVGPIAVAYDLPGVDGLVLDAPTLAKLFSDQITTWDDPAIAALNPGTKLPSTPVQAFRRGDDSGTSDNFQKYLGAAAPQVWTYGAGSKFNGPGGQSAQKSDGVTQAVKSTPGAVTYVEQSFAENASLSIAKIATGAAQPVELSAASASKGLATAKVTGTGNDVTLQLDYATKADGAYPITLVTYEVVCSTGLPADKAALVKAFLTYTASAAGQGILEKNGYAPLPDNIASKVQAAVASLS